MTTAHAWGPAYCPSCRREQRTALFTKDAEGFIWGPECPRCHVEMRSELLDLAGMEYLTPAKHAARAEAFGLLADAIAADREGDA